MGGERKRTRLRQVSLRQRSRDPRGCHSEAHDHALIFLSDLRERSSSSLHCRFIASYVYSCLWSFSLPHLSYFPISIIHPSIQLFFFFLISGIFFTTKKLMSENESKLHLYWAVLYYFDDWVICWLFLWLVDWSIDYFYD